MKHSFKSIFCFLSVLLLGNCSFSQDTVQVVTKWLKQSSIPIKHIEAGNGFADLQPMKKILQNVRVIGLGEATHGTQEFFKIKHRLVEFLVTQMGFTGFALESSYSDCQPINNYILTGKGNLAEVLTGQGYMAWDTEEFSTMLDWMKTYNQTVPDIKKIRFYGIDVLSNNLVGRKNVLAYIQKNAPEKTATTDSIFRVLHDEDHKWPSRLNQSNLQSTFMPLHQLINYVTINKNKLVNSSSIEEWEQIFKYLEVMEQGLSVNVNEVPPELQSQKLTRDEYMAENLLYIMENERPNIKFIVWQHNGHISKRADNKQLGYNLHQSLGDRYYGIAFECYDGTFQTRELIPDGFWGVLKSDTIISMPKSLAWYLRRTGKKNLFLNLRNTTPNSVVEKWLETPIQFNDGYWVYRGPEKTMILKTSRISTMAFYTLNIPRLFAQQRMH